jgi:hypothetical protein
MKKARTSKMGVHMQAMNTSGRHRRHALAMALMAVSPWVCASGTDEPQQALPSQVQALPPMRMRAYRHSCNTFLR